MLPLDICWLIYFCMAKYIVLHVACDVQASSFVAVEMSVRKKGAVFSMGKYV